MDTSNSVKKFTQTQLAQAFVKLSKDSQITRTLIPEIKMMPADVKRMATWKIDATLCFIEGADLNSLVVKLMIYSKKPQLKHSTQKLTNNPVYIAELTKQIDELNSKLRDKPVDRELIEKDIKLKSAMIDKLKKDNTQVDEKKPEFTHEQIGSIAKRVYELMIDGEKKYHMHRELVFASQPEIDHKKESTGGNYTLNNSTRDRRYNVNEMGFGSNFEPQSQSHSSNSNGKIYVPPGGDRDSRDSSRMDKDKRINDRFNQNQSQTEKPALYIPPNRRDQINNHNYSQQSNQSNHSKPESVPEVARYKAPHERFTGSKYGNNSKFKPEKSRNYNENHDFDKNSDKNDDFIDIKELQRHTYTNNLQDFPELSQNEKPKYVKREFDCPEEEKPILLAQLSKSVKTLIVVDDLDTDLNTDIGAWGTEVKSKHVKKEIKQEKQKTFADIAREAKELEDQRLKEEEERLAEQARAEFSSKLYTPIRPIIKNVVVRDEESDSDYSYSDYEE